MPNNAKVTHYNNLPGLFPDKFKVYIREDQIRSDFYLDIWVSRIMAHNLHYTGYDEISIINNYLQRNHDYRTGIDSANGNALILGDDVEGNSAISLFTENNK